MFKSDPDKYIYINAVAVRGPQRKASEFKEGKP
jgi:hypothetical protein